MMQKEWALRPAAPAEHLRRYRGFSRIMAQLLYNRGVEDPTQAETYLSATSLPEDPLEMKDMELAVARISAGIEAGEPMAVYGDFDADGVCSTALMMQVLKLLGADARPYIPDRADEGYGLNSPALRALAKQGIKLVITVDCGIRSVQEIADGIRAGLDIIVTDHHSVGPERPPALAVINPQQEDCAGEARMAGVGVAFMLAQALLRQRWESDRAKYPAGLGLSDLLDLVALGTVADVMPLNVSLNRRFLRHGLDTINEMRRPGIAALTQVAGLRPGGIKASHIGFGLGPRINAAGRLGSAMVAYELLAAETLEEAMPRAAELQALNSRRQQLTRQTQAAIGEQVVEAGDVSLIFAGDENVLSGIAGLVAGRLTEEYYRPAVVLVKGEEESRASCRSIPEFNITDALDTCADLLLRHGGHATAAGFTVRNSNLDALRQALQQLARAAIEGRNLAPKLPIDLEIPLDALNKSFLAEIDRLEPTGQENPAPVFLSRSLTVSQCRRVGAEGKHLRLRLAGENGARLGAIGFGLGDWAKRMPQKIDAAYTVEMNEWNGRRNLQMQLLDIRPAEPASKTVSA